MMRQLLFSVLCLVAIGASAAERESFRSYRASEVRSVDGDVKCLSYRDWWITTLSGPCSDFIPPRKIAIGERFSERGTVHVIRYIVATQALIDVRNQWLNRRAGSWDCVAAQESYDLEQEGSAMRRTWLYIANCEPVR
jgi:hypothetical protein